MGVASWLCRNDAERTRMLEMSSRLRAAKWCSIALLSLSAVIAVPVYGLAMQIPLVVVVGLVVPVVDHWLDRVRRPEWWLAGLWLLSQAAIVLAIGWADGPREYLLSILVVPMLFGGAIFPRRVAAALAAATLLVMALTALTMIPTVVSGAPPVLILPLVSVIVTSLQAARMLDTEDDVRGTAIVDPLTGLHNRATMQARATELSHRMAANSQARAAVVVADIDHFKRINDDHGHAVGDAVLAEVARRLQRVVGQSGALFRFGGEEFVVMLSDGGADAAGELAEALRAATADGPIAGLTVTISLGLAHSSAQVRDYALMFACADRALYRAKAEGRNRVCRSDQRDVPMARERGVRAGSPASPHAAAPQRPVGRGSSAEQDRSLLVRNQAERDHMLDNIHRMRPLARTVNPILFAGLICAVPWLGWQALLPPIISVLVLTVVEFGLLPQLRRPEYAMVAVVVLVFLGGVGGLVVARHSALYALPFMALFMFVNAARMPIMATAVLFAVDLLLTTLAALLIDQYQVLHNPAIVAFPLALMGAMTLYGRAIGEATFQHRAVATTDQLTGALNRAALDRRARELADRDADSAEPHALLLADLDHFKAINDEHGHDAGDRVLVEVAERIRLSLRLFDPVYRIGGEEFVVLLAGATEADALLTAQRIREAVSARPIDGHRVTISVGVAAMGWGSAFDYERAFAAADAALYEAKAAGRDRVFSSARLMPAQAA
jgi:diguanylate cyclase (GGDEF)-like protein